MKDARDSITDKKLCRTCGEAVILVDQVYNAKQKKHLGGQWVHEELPAEVHVPSPAR